MRWHGIRPILIGVPLALAAWIVSMAALTLAHSAGLPVVVTPAIGDLSDAVESQRLGVIVRDQSEVAIDDAAKELVLLWDDEESTRQRCAAWARSSVDVESVATPRYTATYQSLLNRNGRP